MKILVPIDQSEYSQVALKFICDRCANFGADSKIYVVHVRPVSFFGSLFERKGVDKALEEEAYELLDPAVEALKKSGLTAEAVYATGPIAQTINDIAEKENIDLIIMGSQGTGAVQGIIFGSVTNSLLALTYKPMLVLRNKAVTLKDSPYIGLTVDGSEYSESAIVYLRTHMKFFGGTPRIYLLHVVDRPAPGAKYGDYELENEARQEHKDGIDEIFEEATKELEAAGADCRQQILVNNEPAAAIASFAEKEDLDLIVVGTRGQGAFRASVMGSTSSRLAALSDKPLLIIQTDEDAVK